MPGKKLWAIPPQSSRRIPKRQERHREGNQTGLQPRDKDGPHKPGQGPVQATHYSPGEEREVDPETTDTEGEGEETPGRKTAQGQSQMEICGNNTSEFL